MVWQRQRLSYMSQLLHERQLLTQLFHLSSHCELRVSRLHTPVAPEEHWHTATRPTALHRDSFTTVTRYLLNSRICACTASTEECAGGFIFFHRYEEGSEEVRHETWGEQNGGMMKTFTHSPQGYLKEAPVKDRTRAGKWQHHFMMLKRAWRPRLLTFW